MAEDPDGKKPEVPNEKLKLWLDFFKIVVGSAAVGIITVVINSQLKEKDMEMQRLEKQREFLKTFVDKAIDDNIEKKIRLAHYFATLMSGDEGVRWHAYVQELEGGQDTVTLVKELRTENEALRKKILEAPSPAPEKDTTRLDYATLRQSYIELYNNAKLKNDNAAYVNRLAVLIVKNKPQYEEVVQQYQANKMPWYFLAVLHCLETDLAFDVHIHNGDPLAARTVHAPVGRPTLGTPPFTWKQSARDFVELNKYNEWKDWSVPGMLYLLEQHNGFGYRLKHPDVNTPYLWNGTNQYTKGGYAADGKFTDDFKPNIIGGAALLVALRDIKAIDIPATLH